MHMHGKTGTCDPMLFCRYFGRFIQDVIPCTNSQLYVFIGKGMIVFESTQGSCALYTLLHKFCAS